MKTITIPVDVFNREFEDLFDKLKLDLFEQAHTDNPHNMQSQIALNVSGETTLGTMHRRFHYEIARLKERLEEAK